MRPSRASIDFRTIPGSGCSVRISGRPDEVERAGFEHAVASHGHRDTPHERIEVRAAMREELPLVPRRGRALLDCQDLPQGRGCTVSFDGPADDVVRAAFGHLVRAHTCAPTLQLEDEIRLSLKDEVWATTSPLIAATGRRLRGS